MRILFKMIFNILRNSMDSKLAFCVLNSSQLPKIQVLVLLSQPPKCRDDRCARHTRFRRVPK